MKSSTPRDTGTWLVTTQGTRHVWDLDRRTYVRVPGPASHAGPLPADGLPCRITRVGVWPQVGKCSFVWIVEPVPSAVELWRRSSTIERIERLEPGTDVAALLGITAWDAEGPLEGGPVGRMDEKDEAGGMSPSEEQED